MRRSIEVDMSPAAIDQRLKEIGQLYKLWLSFRDARYIGLSEDLKAQRRPGGPQAGIEAGAGLPAKEDERSETE
jgi:hypothetical protein